MTDAHLCVTTRRLDSPDHWFRRDRFGLFVHWGLYSVAARHEWVMSRERIHVSDYDRYRSVFEADLFDPQEWAATAQRAGMRYGVFTSKHHDGFCLWDSALTEYTSMNTPFGRDAVAEFLNAFRAAGLRVGLYHSLLDWHHPDFPIDAHHPRRDDPDVSQQNEHRDIARYREYLTGQVTELLTGYGPIDYLFFDFSYPHLTGPAHLVGKGPDDWGSDNLLDIVRRLQPEAIVNDRLGIPGDFVTPEQYQPTVPMTRNGKPVVWEVCQTINGSWGYDRDNDRNKPADLLVRMLIDSVANDGNMLLNVGPTGRGNFDGVAERTLADIGAWMDLHERSIRGAGPSAYKAPPDCRYTERSGRVYLHLFAWPHGHVHLPGLGGHVRHAQFLHDASDVELIETVGEGEGEYTIPAAQPPGTLTLRLPSKQPNVLVPVVELFLNDEGSMSA